MTWLASIKLLAIAKEKMQLIRVSPRRLKGQRHGIITRKIVKISKDLKSLFNCTSESQVLENEVAKKWINNPLAARVHSIADYLPKSAIPRLAIQNSGEIVIKEYPEFALVNVQRTEDEIMGFFSNPLFDVGPSYYKEVAKALAALETAPVAEAPELVPLVEAMEDTTAEVQVIFENEIEVVEKAVVVSDAAYAEVAPVSAGSVGIELEDTSATTLASEESVNAKNDEDGPSIDLQNDSEVVLASDAQEQEEEEAEAVDHEEENEKEVANIQVSMAPDADIDNETELQDAVIASAEEECAENQNLAPTASEKESVTMLEDHSNANACEVKDVSDADHSHENDVPNVCVNKYAEVVAAATVEETKKAPNANTQRRARNRAVKEMHAAIAAAAAAEAAAAVSMEDVDKEAEDFDIIIEIIRIPIVEVGGNDAQEEEKQQQHPRPGPSKKTIARRQRRVNVEQRMKKMQNPGSESKKGLSAEASPFVPKAASPASPEVVGISRLSSGITDGSASPCSDDGSVLTWTAMTRKKAPKSRFSPEREQKVPAKVVAARKPNTAPSQAKPAASASTTWADIARKQAPNSRFAPEHKVVSAKAAAAKKTNAMPSQAKPAAEAKVMTIAKKITAVSSPTWAEIVRSKKS